MIPNVRYPHVNMSLQQRVQDYQLRHSPQKDIFQSQQFIQSQSINNNYSQMQNSSYNANQYTSRTQQEAEKPLEYYYEKYNLKSLLEQDSQINNIQKSQLPNKNQDKKSPEKNEVDGLKNELLKMQKVVDQISNSQIQSQITTPRSSATKSDDVLMGNQKPQSYWTEEQIKYWESYQQKLKQQQKPNVNPLINAPIFESFGMVGNADTLKIQQQKITHLEEYISQLLQMNAQGNQNNYQQYQENQNNKLYLEKLLNINEQLNLENVGLLQKLEQQRVINPEEVQELRKKQKEQIQIRSLSKDNQEASQKLIILAEEFSKLTKYCNGLEDDLSLANLQIQEYKDLHQKINDKQAKINEEFQKSELVKLQTFLEEKNTTIRTLNKVIEEQEETIEESKKKLILLAEEVESLHRDRKKNEDLIAQCQSTQIKLYDTTKLNNIQQELFEKQKFDQSVINQKLQIQLAHKDADIKLLQQELKINHNKHSENEIRNQQKNELEQRNKALIFEMDQMAAQIKEKNKKLEQLALKINALESQNIEYKKMLKS